MTTPNSRLRSGGLFLALALAALGALAFASGQVTRPPETASSAERFLDWTQPVFPPDEYARRHAQAIALLGHDDVLLIPSAEGTSAGETFRQFDDFEYFTGLEVPRSLLVIDGRDRRTVLFTPARDPRFENPGRPNDFPGRPLAPDPNLRERAALDEVAPDDRLASFFKLLEEAKARILLDGGGRTDGLDTTPSTMFDPPSPAATLAAFLSRAHPSLTVGDASALMAKLRMVKSAREIAIMKRAANATSAAISRGGASVRPGVDERTLTGAFIANCMEAGAQRVAFTPIIKSGPNSLWPWRILGAHYDRRNRALRAGELVIYDVGCEVDHYVSDVGRTFPVASTFSPRQRELVDMVRRISDAVIAAARPGLTLAGLQQVARASIPAEALDYMQAPLYFGHHIGLDAGDPALNEAALVPGMIFTIEPWYYNHDQGVAVFIEDEVLITPGGSENLTASLPRDAASLERLRRGPRKP